MNTSQRFKNLLGTEMDRAGILKYPLVAILALVGISRLLAVLSAVDRKTPDKQKPEAGYGGMPYGRS